MDQVCKNWGNVSTQHGPYVFHVKIIRKSCWSHIILLDWVVKKIDAEKIFFDKMTGFWTWIFQRLNPINNGWNILSVILNSTYWHLEHSVNPFNIFHVLHTCITDLMSMCMKKFDAKKKLFFSKLSHGPNSEGCMAVHSLCVQLVLKMFVGKQIVTLVNPLVNWPKEVKPHLYFSCRLNTKTFILFYRNFLPSIISAQNFHWRSSNICAQHVLSFTFAD